MPSVSGLKDNDHTDLLVSNGIENFIQLIVNIKVPPPPLPPGIIMGGGGGVALEFSHLSKRFKFSITGCYINPSSHVSPQIRLLNPNLGFL
jgi:hypothetical protein